MSGLVLAPGGRDSAAMTKYMTAFASLLVLAGCTHQLAPADDVRRTGRIGQTVRLGLVTIQPLQVMEDSRCPVNVQCVQPGRLRLRAEIRSPSGARERMLTMGESHQVAGGTLTFQDARPRRTENGMIRPEAYAFRFSYLMPTPRRQREP
jgi:hypothetical protein